MSTHLPVFQSFSAFFILFCIDQISHQQLKGKEERKHGFAKYLEEIACFMSVLRFSLYFAKYTALWKGVTKIVRP